MTPTEYEHLERRFPGSGGSERRNAPKRRRQGQPTGSRSASVRVAGGFLKGRKLPVASGVRPTSSRLREALFSIWQTRIESCRFLDLFAGSGAIGLEAISRGAASAVLVESSPRVFRNLKTSVRALAPDDVRIVRTELPGGLERLAGSRFDLIFADPPYAYRQVNALLEGIAPLLAADGELVLEHSRELELEPPRPWQLRDRRRYGDSCFSFLKLEGELDP